MFQVVTAQIRMDRKGQCGPRGLLGDRTVPGPAAQRGKALLEMEGKRIVDGRAYSVLLEMSL